MNGTSLAINTNGTDYGEDDSETGTEGPPEMPEHVREMIEVNKQYAHLNYKAEHLV